MGKCHQQNTNSHLFCVESLFENPRNKKILCTSALNIYIMSTFILLFYICKNVIFIHRITSLFLRPWQIPPLAPVSRRGGIFMMNVHWSRTSEDQVEKFEIVEWLIETAHWKVLKLGGHQSSENSPLPSPVSVPVNWLHNHSQDNHQTTVLKYYKSVKYWGNRMKLT